MTTTSPGSSRTASLLDYMVPTATDVPPVDLLHMELAEPGHQHGVRGWGGRRDRPRAAIANAIGDALGVEFNYFPITPSRSEGGKGALVGVVDVHTHYLADALVTAMEARSDLPRISGTGDERVIEYGRGNAAALLPAMVDLERQEREMAEASVDLAVITVNLPGVDWFTPADGAAIARDVNDELADLVRAKQDRLAALAVIPLQAPEQAAAELERAVGGGLRGAMIYSNVAGDPLDPETIGAVLDVAAELDVPLMIHPTYPLSAPTMDAYALIPSLGFLVDTTTAALRLILGGAYEERPELKLVLCHAGSLLPQLAGRIDYEAERHGERGLGGLDGKPSERMRLLYTDVVCAWPPALRNTAELVGTDRMMFGSDYPFWEHSRSRDALERAGFEPGESSRIERENAQRLFGLPESVG